MPDDTAIATAAAERVLNDEIKQFVPPMFQNRIPPNVVHEVAGEIAKAVIGDLAAAHDK